VPTKDILDEVVPDRPVFLSNRDHHAAWVNSRALEVAGVTSETADPADGRIERDADGEPTGTLHEGAAYTVDDSVVPAPDQAAWEAAILSAQRHLHGLGITAWQDAWVTPDTQQAYESLVADGRLTARVVGALWWDRHRGIDQLAELLTRRERGLAAGAGRFLPSTVKIMADGVIENGTAALLEPYGDRCGGDTGNTGLSYLDRDRLAAAVTALDAEGFQVHLHTIGDRAVRNALDAIASARAVNGGADHRHHLAHLQLVHPDDVPRLGRLGVAANCQTYWAQHEPQMDELTVPYLGRDRAQRQYPFADLLRAGARLAMGSDWPVTTADPLQQMEVAVTRVDPGHRDAAPFLPEQRLSLAEALHGFTSGSAYVNHDDREAGSLEVGKRADLAILDTDLFADGAPPIGDARVEYTLAAGRIVHEPR
jgi:predicted amidohydrolase YtcJ